MFWGPRPQIQQAPDKLTYGRQIAITVSGDSSSIDSVVLVRNTTLTHLVDGDQRSVVLPVIARAGHTIVVKTPPDGNVAPPGPYLLFVNQKTDKGLVPSVGRETFLEP
jgi:hypothetical protein